MQPGATGAAFAASCKTRWSTTTPVHRFSTLMAELGGSVRHICRPPETGADLRHCHHAQTNALDLIRQAWP